jgi:hypothetical protein
VAGTCAPRLDSAVRLFTSNLAFTRSGTSVTGLSYTNYSDLKRTPGGVVVQRRYVETTPSAPPPLPSQTIDAYYPTSSGWSRGIVLSSSDVQQGAGPIGFDPNTGATFDAATQRYYREGLYISSFDGTATTTWKLPVQSITGLIPIDRSSYIIVSGRDARRWHDSTPGMSFTFPTEEDTANTRYQRLLGDHFLRHFATHWRDSSGIMVDVTLALELYDLSGHLLKRATITRPGPWLDYTIVQRPRDGALVLLTGAPDGLHAALLDSGLGIFAADNIICAPGTRVAAPSAVVRGDMLYAVWEDYRNGNADIYGAAWEMPSEIAHTGEPDIPLAALAATISATPVPADHQVTLTFTLREPSRISIDLFDVAGRDVLQMQSVRFDAGDRSLRLQVADLRPGEYLALVRDDRGGSSSMKLLVVH